MQLHKNLIFSILILFILLGFAGSGCNIIYNKRHGNSMREQEKKKQKQEAVLDRDYQKQKEHQYKMQTADTRKRMVESKKQAEKLNRQSRKASGKKGCRIFKK